MKYLNFQATPVILFLIASLATKETRAGHLPDSIPNGWRAARMNTPEFVLGTDRAVQHAGMASAFIKCDPAPTRGKGSLMQSIAADDYRNKRVRLTV